MTTIKKYLKPFLTGIVVTLIMVIVMLKITMNFQILLFLGAFIFLVAGLINSNFKKHFLLVTLLITMIYLLVFILLVLEEIPELWYFVPIYFATTFLGLLYKNHKQKILVSLALLTITMLFMAIKVIPKDLENRLTQTRFEQLPVFSINEMSGNVIDSETLKGKIVILDFFGTWCKPCVQELKELDKIQRVFKERDDVVFYIINADLGGDTPEKFKEFIKNHEYKFKFAYDYNSEIYKLLKFQQLGLPTLLIIDKEQNIRLQHVGYNTAETNFSKYMIETINGLK
ncbi:TlpA family protein disulfide reductase [Aquimarina sp. 2304DJ70-9]|uniref:TlpA family protein disulfide reductase n=1 Tax=Aquimarina penaris TaxID=3231044 RepID=UPI0034619BD2